MPPLLTRPDAVIIAVDACEAPRVNATGRAEEVDCFVRDVISFDGVTAVAAAESFRVTWPIFSGRPERGHPRFHDPGIGEAFVVRFDWRDAVRLLIFAAEPASGHS